MNNNLKILIIEDNEEVAHLMAKFLIDCHFKVTIVNTITDGISHTKQNRYDIILLDLDLPDYNGFEFLKSVKNTIAVPVIIISAFDEIQTKVKAFKYGASDYMTKPIHFQELEVRIWAVLGRYSEIKLNEVQKKQIFEIRQTKIFFQQKELKLTIIEFEILSILVKNKNNTISREILYSSLVSINSDISLNYHIKNIRKKLKIRNQASNYIKTIYGVGYMLVI